MTTALTVRRSARPPNSHSPSRSSVVCRQAAAMTAMPGPGSAEERRNIAIFVEPSPFSHISGMKNRFECLIRNLTDQGDDVIVFTPDKSPPKEYYGAKARPTPAPWPPWPGQQNAKPARHRAVRRALPSRPAPVCRW